MTSGKHRLAAEESRGRTEQPSFAAFIEAAELGELVTTYAEPLREDEVAELHGRLDAIEPAHVAAAARMHTLFSG